MYCFYIHTHTHIGGQPVLLGFLQREEILQRNFTELSVHFSVKRKKKKTSIWLSIHLLFSRVRFFWRNDYRSANKQRLLNVYSVMLLYIVYYGPRQLGNQAYFKGVRGKGGGEGPFSSITTIKTINLLQPGIPQFRWTQFKLIPLPVHSHSLHFPQPWLSMTSKQSTVNLWRSWVM